MRHWRALPAVRVGDRLISVAAMLTADPRGAINRICLRRNNFYRKVARQRRYAYFVGDSCSTVDGTGNSQTAPPSPSSAIYRFETQRDAAIDRRTAIPIPAGRGGIRVKRRVWDR